MSKLDDAIRDALSQDEAEQLEMLAKRQGLIGLAMNTFQSQLGFFMWASFIVTFVTFGLAVWMGWHFYSAATGREMALWGFGAGLFFYMMGTMKFWFLQQMDKQEILREIKRMELQLALLAKKVA